MKIFSLYRERALPSSPVKRERFVTKGGRQYRRCGGVTVSGRQCYADLVQGEEMCPQHRGEEAPDEYELVEDAEAREAVAEARRRLDPGPL